MESDFQEIFDVYRSLLVRCKEQVLTDGDATLCKTLQTKIGISLTQMKQIDFGDVIVQNFMSDLDFFSAVVDNLFLVLETQVINDITSSLDEMQEIRTSLVHSISRLIPTTKEFYLTKV